MGDRIRKGKAAAAAVKSVRLAGKVHLHYTFTSSSGKSPKFTLIEKSLLLLLGVIKMHEPFPFLLLTHTHTHSRTHKSLGNVAHDDDNAAAAAPMEREFKTWQKGEKIYSSYLSAAPLRRRRSLSAVSEQLCVFLFPPFFFLRRRLHPRPDSHLLLLLLQKLVASISAN